LIIRSYFYFSLCILLISPVQILWAADHGSVAADFFDEAPLILTASRMSKPLSESPASVSVIDRQMIESSGAREIADLFRLVPGFIVGQFSGNKPVVTYHGMGSEFPRKMQVLVDGRSVFIPSFGGVPWSNLPLLLQDIERIEIIRGPNAVTYGANAFLATINIITRHAAEDFGARYSVTSSDNANPDIKDAYVRFGWHHDDLDWRLSLGTLKDDGFDSVNDSIETVKFNFRLDFLSGDNSFWTIQLGSSNSISGLGSAGNPLNVERDADSTNNYLNILWERNSAHSTSSIRLTHTGQDVINNFSTDPLSGYVAYIDFGRISKRTDLELIQSAEISDQLRLAYGGSLRQDRVKSQFLLNDDNFHDVDTGRLFGALESRPDQNWLLDLGATVENSHLSGREISPRFSAIRKLNRRHAIRFVASKAKRNPILYEHSGSTIFNVDSPAITVETWQGNPNIEPENIVSYEFGLRSQFKHRLASSDVKLFSYRISDHIISVPTGNSNTLGKPIKTAANQDTTRVTGLELSLDFSPMPDLDIKSGFSFVAVDSTEPGFEASFPDSSAFINTSYRWQNQHQFSASFYYVGEMQWLDSKYLVPAIKKLDLRYTYRIDPKNETRIELIAHNVLGKYEDYHPENIQEQSYFLRFSGGF
jgi:iron complex outermembrane receptor protein